MTPLQKENEKPSYQLKMLFAAHLLPGHGHVLQQLVHSVWHKLERPKIHSLVMPEFPGRHVTMILRGSTIYDHAPQFRLALLYFCNKTRGAGYVDPSLHVTQCRRRKLNIALVDAAVP